MGNKRRAIRNLEELFESLHGDVSHEISWGYETWPSIMHACIATAFFDGPFKRAIRDAGTVEQAQKCARHLFKLHPEVVVPAKERLFQLQGLLQVWQDSCAGRVSEAAG
ncbi:MAG: hypothetical protein V4681_00685 [Patescibacteria group bacterium]